MLFLQIAAWLALTLPKLCVQTLIATCVSKISHSAPQETPLYQHLPLLSCPVVLFIFGFINIYSLYIFLHLCINCIRSPEGELCDGKAFVFCVCSLRHIQWCLEDSRCSVNIVKGFPGSFCPLSLCWLPVLSCMDILQHQV